uniref:Spermatogenesis-associated protein 46 isoform X1 n=1 Tax=Geotrypetes seraphini TaxID=260995 RepID=A0A6P8SEW7_GEOSA|nr:spermatogenesis-associated protein 46 isoform X1 [Geotrypetes seraphini]XP_033817341.1 spermatogenesis-associated protein 46 isoform X1 [Geotrypetes seraphini]
MFNLFAAPLAALIQRKGLAGAGREHPVLSNASCCLAASLGIHNTAATSEEIGTNQQILDVTDLTVYSKAQAYAGTGSRCREKASRAGRRQQAHLTELPVARRKLKCQGGSAFSTFQNQESTHINCSIYRPWYSPYSYYACTGKESLLDSCSSQGTSTDNVREVTGDSTGLLEISKSIPSNSSSLGSPCPNASQWKLELVQDSKDSISPQDILAASKWLPEQQSGYKCVACCRMFPTLHSLQNHIRHGFREGFSCRVFYRKIKTFWERDNVQKTTDESFSETEQLPPPSKAAPVTCPIPSNTKNKIPIC